MPEGLMPEGRLSGLPMSNLPTTRVRMHATCVARDGEGVLLLGPSGAGKSDLALRLLGRGFALVADDQVDIIDGMARAPERLAGLLEVRGLGIVRLPYLSQAKLKVVITLTDGCQRLPFLSDTPACICRWCGSMPSPAPRPTVWRWPLIARLAG